MGEEGVPFPLYGWHPENRLRLVLGKKLNILFEIAFWCVLVVAVRFSISRTFEFRQESNRNAPSIGDGKHSSVPGDDDLDIV